MELTIVYGEIEKKVRSKPGSCNTLRQFTHFLLKSVFDSSYYYDGADIVTSSQIPDYFEYFTPADEAVDLDCPVLDYITEHSNVIHARPRNLIPEGLMPLPGNNRNADIGKIQCAYHLWLTTYAK